MDNRNRVLVVDDNDANVMVLSTMLRRLGYEVDGAMSGMEAIDYICKEEYDLVFMDHLMPEMDGVETVRQIQVISQGKKVPLIFGVSATVDDEIVDAFHRAGARDVLTKPISMGKLEEKLAELNMNMDEVSEEQTEPGDDIDGILSAVRGLDYKKGLDMMAGSVENYMKVLMVSIKNIMGNYNSIDLVRDTRQAEVFALHFHSQKGIFLNIGADAMAEQARRLEMASKDGNLEEIQASLDGYMDELLAFHSALKEAYGRYASSRQTESPVRAVSVSEFMEDLNKLRQHIEDFEYIEITETLEKMLSGSQGRQMEGLQKISVAIQEFDYDEALRQVDALEAEL